MVSNEFQSIPMNSNQKIKVMKRRMKARSGALVGNDGTRGAPTGFPAFRAMGCATGGREGAASRAQGGRAPHFQRFPTISKQFQ